MFSWIQSTLSNTFWKNICQNQDRRLINAQRLFSQNHILFLFCCWVSSADTLVKKALLLLSERICLQLWFASSGVAAVEGWKSKDVKIETLSGPSHVWLPYFRTLRLAPLGYECGCNSTHRFSSYGFWTILKQLNFATL